MSVFSDFQRLWMQRFPQSSLSDAWEQDVRASLERHKLKIIELTKELEQETLYVEYLERLLSDVEKYRETGGDPTTLFEAATAASQSEIGNNFNDFADESSVTLREHDGGGGSGGVAGNEKRISSLSKNRDSNKYSSFNSGSSSGGSFEQNEKLRLAENMSGGGGGSNYNHEDTKDIGSEKDVRNIQIQKNGALNQCITELTSGFKPLKAASSSSSSSTNIGGATKNTNYEDNLVSDESSVGGGGGGGIKTSAASHFVTVIEVNEGKSDVGDKSNDDETAAAAAAINAHLSRETSPVAASTRDAALSSASSTTLFPDHEQQQQQQQQDVVSFSSFERKVKVEPSAPPMSPAMTTSSTSGAATSPSAFLPLVDAKRKMPPRPPPKNIRRVEPPTIPGGGGNIALSSSPKREMYAGSAMPIPTIQQNESPSSSLERNIKPSDILRQKSSDSLEAKSFASNRKTTPEIGKFMKSSDLVEEFGRKIGKSESLEKTKRTDADISRLSQSPTGSLGRTSSTPSAGRSSAGSGGGGGGGGGGVNTASPTGSLSKFSNSRFATDSSSTGSLDKKPRGGPNAELSIGGSTYIEGGNVQQTLGSKESLASQGNISEIIKSYESISSLSSDSTKAAQNLDNEPYYDTVPLDNGDGEYVYIKPGGTGSSSSRDDLSTPCSTLPMTTLLHHQQQQQHHHHHQHHQHHHHGGSHLSSQTSVAEPESPGRTSNYVNIDYFLHQSNETRSSSLDSDGEYDGPPILRTISHDEQTSQTPAALRKASGNVRGSKIRSILNSIIQSETIYVECLNKMIQYKKAIHATLGTSQPVIKEDEENTIFFKIDELHDVHTAFLNDLKTIVGHEGGDVLVGETFKRLADMFNLYSAFLHNYGQAIETVKKCSANNPQFKKIVSTIVLNLQTEQSLTLEDLLHKPVARVQINALVFNDLLNETPPNHPDHQPLRQAHKTIHMFLKQFNVVNQRLPNESNKNLRRMVKNSFIVELVDGHRKLRHLFLFNDVIACAKYKASGRDRLEYELKWFIPLKDVCVYDEDATADLKESSPANILQLKTQACTVRDQILLEEKDEKVKKANGLRTGDKHRRKLADLESQLVLASPNLVFRIGNKATNKTLTFFLSSDFERTQWIDSIMALKQQTCNIPGASTINALDIHAFILAMQKGMKTEMGSYLMRNTNDESLLVGDLHMTVQGLTGLDHPSDLYICIEVDSYGHYFRKATTKMVCRSTCPLWNESFVLELEGSQNVRVLLYEAHDRPVLRAKYVLRLSRTWLQETPTNRPIKLGETITLNTSLRFVPGEVTLRRVPTSKPGALFGAKMSHVLKREKRDIPFIISACIREVERRGMAEVGIYRVSGSASDLAKLKKSFETNAYEAEQLLKDVDIHSVTGILKSYLRELPEALFSDLLYPRLFETFNQFSNNNETARIKELMTIFEELPLANKASINHILDHLIRVHRQEADNKMSLHNLAMVFGPTLLRPGQTQTKQKDLLASSTVDVMAQAGILYCFLQARIKKD